MGKKAKVKVTPIKEKYAASSDEEDDGFGGSYSTSIADKQKQWMMGVKVPKSQFLAKIKASKRRRSVLWLISLGATGVNIYFLIGLFFALTEPRLAEEQRHHAFGWTVLYNTQAKGQFFNMEEVVKAVWMLFAQALFAVVALVLKAIAIKTRERDIAKCSKKATLGVVLKIIRLLLLGVALFWYFYFVSDMENPKIRDDLFYRECRLIPRYSSDGPIRNLIGNYPDPDYEGCYEALEAVGRSEADYKGWIPEGEGIRLLFMEPMPTQFGCDVTQFPRYFSFRSRPLRNCASDGIYRFSNWITLHDDCDALVYNNYYEDTNLQDGGTGNPDVYAEQWFCGIDAFQTDDGRANLTYSTVGFRHVAPNCFTPGLDPPELSELEEGTTVSFAVDDLTSEQWRDIIGASTYEELTQCTNTTVSCITDIQDNSRVHRALQFEGCETSFYRTDDPQEDQAVYDYYLENIKSAYTMSGIGRITIMTQMMYLALALTHEVVALFL